jgi:quinol monooxygenase YgiN
MDNLEISARLKVREGQLEGFKRQAAEIIRQTQEQDTKTLRYDWFLNSDQTECEVREEYASSEGFIEHRMHVGEEIKKMFAEFAYGHAVTIYGDPSPQLAAMMSALHDVDIKRYAFLQGLQGA